MFWVVLGGWDWAPYSFMRDPDGNPAWTKGIWKGVYMVGIEKAAAAAITYVVPHVKYAGGDYPTTPLVDGEAPFVVDTKVFLHAAEDGVKGTVTITGEWGATKKQAVTLHAGENNVTISLEAATPKIWWANGMGAQPLYNVTATFEADDAAVRGTAAGSPASPPTVVRRVGFRHVVLVTFNDTNKTFVAEAEQSKLQGNGDHTLMFRMNGAPFFAKGANMIPMESLEGRYEPGMHTQLVANAADGGMNMLRVWGYVVVHLPQLC